MEKAVTSKVEQAVTCVSYEVCGTRVDLDIDIVKKYLVRGRAEYVTNQELVLFINTCKMQKLNPLANGEVYLIKYSKEEPASLVIGKDSYLKRAFFNPNYLDKEDGIVVMRGDEVIRKEGCCLYPGETLIGGWCRVHYLTNGREKTAFREVSLKEYDKGQANWKSKPATMINKVAISQCLRDAFPADFEGLYSEDELVASGLMTETGTIQGEVVAEDRVITQEERKLIFSKYQEKYGKEEGNARIKQLLEDEGLTSTADMKLSMYERIIDELQADDQEEQEESEQNDVEQDAVEDLNDNQD